MERSVSAWALPRPSATASAKLANSTVSHSHAAIVSTNPGRPAPAIAPPAAAMPITVVRMLPMNTTNMTGLRNWTRGSQLPERIADRAHHDRAGHHRLSSSRHGFQPAPVIWRCSTMGPSASAGRNVSAPTISTTPTSMTTNNGHASAECPRSPRSRASLPGCRRWRAPGSSASSGTTTSRCRGRGCRTACSPRCSRTRCHCCCRPRRRHTGSRKSRAARD